MRHLQVSPKLIQECVIQKAIPLLLIKILGQYIQYKVLPPKKNKKTFKISK
ncbi:hypothetical protein X474_04120 [Dethiosulfatarculus sandiegensis]|uniref:Uncharacterized protein n=1 Tax=Dethiosulfatarculus sandiegensis TaxID=1429043 RepID=A0A0D2HYW4_9BACT|nr:hypothetical protein X474_04120 [Dethiosulfatarculus sandiegensis]